MVFGFQLQRQDFDVFCDALIFEAGVGHAVALLIQRLYSTTEVSVGTRHSEPLRN